jgi:methionyl-tRNA formyltransferase
VAIAPDERAGELTARLATLGAPVLSESLEGLASGRLVPEPQDETRATLAPKLSAADGILDWSRPAAELVRRVRACHPRPGASTTFRGRRIKVFRASVGDEVGDAPAGLVLDDLPRVAAADHFVVLEEVQAEGRRAMPGAVFARGLRLMPGERCG